MPTASVADFWLAGWGPPTPPITTVDSGSPGPRKPLDLSIPEYGILVLLLRKLRQRRKAIKPTPP